MLTPQDGEGITDCSDIKRKDSPSLQAPQGPRAAREVQVAQKESLQMCPDAQAVSLGTCQACGSQAFLEPEAAFNRLFKRF